MISESTDITFTVRATGHVEVRKQGVFLEGTVIVGRRDPWRQATAPGDTPDWPKDVVDAHVIAVAALSAAGQRASAALPIATPETLP